MKFISLILLGLFLSSYCISSEDLSILKDLTKEGLNIVRTCTNSLMQVFPPMWCWKKNGDAGLIPTGCPNGYFRSAALCYQNCKAGYSFTAGVCYERCGVGFKDNGLSCFKNIIRWYFKRSYIPRSITNFDSLIPCPGNTYRGGALCYRDCNLIFMENCGIGACAADAYSCATTIIKMITDVITGLIDFVTFCLSFGSSAGVTSAKGQLAGSVKKVGEGGIKSAFQTLKNIFVKKFKSAIEGKAKQLAGKLFLLDPFLKSFSTQVGELCGTVFKAIEGKLEVNPLPSPSSLVESLDVFGIAGIAKSCSSGDGLSCAKSVLSSLKSFDPTGLLTIATTFMQPVCDVPVWASNDMPFLENDIDFSCFEFYSERNFRGNVTKICGSDEALNDKVPPFKSMRSSIDSVFSFYSKPNFKGTVIKIGKGATVEDIAELTSEIQETSFLNHLKSVRLLRDECIYLRLNRNGEEFNREICESMESIYTELSESGIDLTKSPKNNADDLFELGSLLNKEPPNSGSVIEAFSAIPTDKFTSVFFETSDSTTAMIFNGEHFTGEYQTIGGEDQQLDKTELHFKDIKSIQLEFNYNANGFLCGYEAETSEIIRQSGDEVECFSFDGINCIRKQMNKVQCTRYVNKNIKYMKPLRCGLDHHREFEVIGYLIDGHWCQKGMKYFNVKPAILE